MADRGSLTVESFLTPTFYLQRRSRSLSMGGSATPSSTPLKPSHKQETQLRQRDRATHCVSWNWNLLNCCATVYEKFHLKRFATDEWLWPWRSLKVIGIVPIRWVMCHFLLVVCSNNISILRISEILQPSQCMRLRVTLRSYSVSIKAKFHYAS